MKRIVLNNRQKNPAYFDLIVQHPANGCSGFFRIGDRAAAHICLLEWRQDNPERKLIILDMPDAHNETLSCLIARQCPAEWVFGDLADELWLVDQPNELLPKPDAEPLYTQRIWEWWYHFNKRSRNIQPTIRPPVESLEKAKVLREKWNLPKRYATFQPLFDAPYAEYRNQPPEFWYEIANNISQEIPLVILGHPDVTKRMKTPVNAIAAWSESLNVLESMALIEGATMHVGGETGTTIWSSIFGTHTYAIYANVIYEDLWFVEPISFGGQVRINKTMDVGITTIDIREWWKNLTIF